MVEHCVLALLREGESYAFEIVRVLGARGLVTSEGTIYPLLARLRRDGLVTDGLARVGHAGRRAATTGSPTTGDGCSTTFVADWTRFRDAVDALLPGAPEE